MVVGILVGDAIEAFVGESWRRKRMESHLAPLGAGRDMGGACACGEKMV